MLHVPEECLFDDFKNQSFEEKLAYAKENYGYYEDLSRQDAIDFYLDGVDEQKLKDYYKAKKRNVDDMSFAMFGLVEMLENEIIKPACVDWSSFSDILLRYSDSLMDGLICHRIQYETIKCIYKQRELIFRNTFGCPKKDITAKWKAWVEKYKDLAKLEQEQLKEKAKQQAKQTAKLPKEKPEYIVSLEEMLEYYSNEGDSIIAFINHCAINKNEWFNKTVQNMIKKAQVAHHNTFNIKGNYNEIHGNTNLTVKNE